MRNLAIGIGILFISLAALALASGWGFSNRVKTEDVPSIVAPLVKDEAVKQVAAALKDPETRKALMPTEAEFKAHVAAAIANDPTIKSLRDRTGGLDETAIVALIKKTVTTDPDLAEFIKAKKGTKVAPIDEAQLRILVLEMLFCDPDVALLFERNRIDEDALLARLKEALLTDTTFVVEVCCAGLYCLPGCYLPPAPVVVTPMPTPAPVVITPAPTPPAPEKPVKATRAAGSWTVTQTVSIVNKGDGVINIYRGADATK